MRETLAKLLSQAVNSIVQLKEIGTDRNAFIRWCDAYPAQIVALSSQIMWTREVEAVLISTSSNMVTPKLQGVLKLVEETLVILTEILPQEQDKLRRIKLEQLINVFNHKERITRRLMESNVLDPEAYEWLFQMRFQFDSNQAGSIEQLYIHMANFKFRYGYEYLGGHELLVQTPLTEDFYLSMTQALKSSLGGSPFGPAGTGKTESVKALGYQLGVFVRVFNCDETFDIQAMDRIFVGLCKVNLKPQSLWLN